MAAEFNKNEKRDNDKKDNGKKDNDKKPKQNNWVAFGIHVLVSFIIVLVTGLLGANFVYYTRLINLDKMFPSDEKKPPYTEPSSTSSNNMNGGKKMKGGNSNASSMCGPGIDFTESPIYKNKYFRGMFEYGSPYSSESGGSSFFSIIGDWFVNKIKYSYIWLRMFIKYIIQFTGSTCEFLPDSMKDLLAFIFGPVIISIMIVAASLWWLPTLVSTFVKDSSEWGVIISIIGLFFGWTWTVPVILSVFQVIGLVFSFVVLPLLMNGNKLMEIMGNKFNSYYLLLLLLTLVTIGAFTQLNSITAIVMLIVFLISSIPPGMNPLAKND